LFYVILSDFAAKNNVYLYGPAGTGKTYIAKEVAKAVGYKTITINCNQFTAPLEIIGGQTIDGYQEGKLIEAWGNLNLGINPRTQSEYEGALLLIDELPKLDPNTAGLLNAALAETAAQPKYDDANNVIERTIPFITNGRGDKVYKGEGYPKGKVVPEDLKFRFGVIATGNTDMMSVGNKYGGNQRQDYSLVDRFAGSFYTLDVDVTKEKSLTYSYVFKVSNALRIFLQELDAPQSISLRTMLNFNRTYEQQKLYTLGNSVFADAIYDSNGKKVAPKSIKDSLTSFKSLLEPEMRKLLDFDVKGADFRAAVDDTSLQSDSRFKLEFIKKYRLDPKTGAEVSKEELERIEKDLDLMTQKNK
jgi:cobaltochelatase CobS